MADASRKDVRGAAFRLLNLVTGLALLAASVLAGALWLAYGSPATFLVGAAFALAAPLTPGAIGRTNHR